MKKFLAYDGINCEYEEFETIEQAQEWLKEVFLDADEGYHTELDSCKIFELKQVVDYDVIDSKDNYKYMHDEDIPEDDEESKACPFGGCDYDEIWKHKFVNV